MICRADTQTIVRRRTYDCLPQDLDRLFEELKHQRFTGSIVIEVNMNLGGVNSVVAEERKRLIASDVFQVAS